MDGELDSGLGVESGSIRLLSSVDGVWYPFVLRGFDGFTRPKELTHVDVDY